MRNETEVKWGEGGADAVRLDRLPVGSVATGNFRAESVDALHGVGRRLLGVVDAMTTSPLSRYFASSEVSAGAVFSQ
jgi:hypothetical protein